MNPHATMPTQGYPRKLFYRIGEVADIVGVKAYVLRYWETEFPELNPEKDGSDQRRYRPRDVHTALAIRKLLYEDRFTIKGARGRLRDEIRGSESSERSAGRSGGALAAADADRAHECDDNLDRDGMNNGKHGRESVNGRAPLASPSEMRRELSRLRDEVLDLVALLDH